MALLKITLEVSLEELFCLSAFVDNTESLMKDIKAENHLATVSFVNSQERNLAGIKDLMGKIEPLVEKY